MSFKRAAGRLFRRKPGGDVREWPGQGLMKAQNKVEPVMQEEDDSPVTVLQSLEQERGTIFTEKEYQEIRGAIIEELARGPRPRVSLLATFSVVGLLLLVLTVIGFFIVIRGLVTDYTLAITGTCALLVWGYLLHGYIRTLERHAQRSVRERLAELQELQQHRLLSQEEFDRIYAAIHMAREMVFGGQPR